MNLPKSSEDFTVNNLSQRYAVVNDFALDRVDGSYYNEEDTRLET